MISLRSVVSIFLFIYLSYRIRNVVGIMFISITSLIVGNLTLRVIRFKFTLTFMKMVKSIRIPLPCEIKGLCSFM